VSEVSEISRTVTSEDYDEDNYGQSDDDYNSNVRKAEAILDHA